MNNRFLLFFHSLFLASLVFITGCSKTSETPVDIGNREQILHIGNGDEPQDIDPHVTTGLPEFHIQSALFEGLVSKDPKTLDVIPGVAESWEVSEDGRTYIFKIRETARWSNGENITAKDFVDSYERALLPKLGNQYAYSLHVIENAKAFNLGEISDFSVVGIKAVDDRTLEFKLTNRVPYFLQLLDHHSMYPVHVPTIKKHGEIDRRGNRWTRAENFVGNGPFVIKEWKINSIFSVKKNPYYWDSENVKLNEIHFYPIQDTAAEERMYRAGQLHKVNDIPVEKVPVYREKNYPGFRQFPKFATYFYRFNTTIEPLNDVRVRKALAYSIDRVTLVEKVTKGGQLPAYNFTPLDTNGYTAEAQVSYDPELARQLLAEAGYANGEGFPKLTILYNTMESHKKIALAFQQMWKKELNVDVQLENQDWKVYLANQRAMNYQIARAAWVGDYYDVNTFLDMFVKDGGNNETGWFNPEYDKAIELAAQSETQQERYEHFQRAEAILIDELPIMPVYFYMGSTLIRESVKGWHDNALDFYSYKGVYLEADK